MRIGYLGAGTWGFCLASLLASKGHDVVLWTASADFAKQLNDERVHPKLPRFPISDTVVITSSLPLALENIDLLVESVTSRGVRPTFERVLSLGEISCPIVLTSKGIEQNNGLLLPEVVLEVMGADKRKQIAVLSGPSHAEEVIHQLPTAIVCASYDVDVGIKVIDAFTTPFFRIYPNPDVEGVAFGGALKNIIAIACGISDGLGFGDNTKAALMTRGLHEMRKLCSVKGGQSETLTGLSGLGDLCVTCLSRLSRNYMFGRLIAEGLSPQIAQERIGMVVEGVYTCVSAWQLGKKKHVALPITQAVYDILYGGMQPRDAVKSLLQRAIKEEHL